MDHNKANILTIGKRVIATERDALAHLADALGVAFVEATLLMSKIGLDQVGRIIVSGMGKSGYIAQKIAATLASTGTPAQFVHPAEAAHGDLGMITAHDVIIAISNSGETAELAALLDYARSHKIDLIAITSNPHSTLAKISKIALILPVMPEASEIGLAPTTSTTLSLALGDALCVALMEYRQFSPEQFKIFHPGGALGQQLNFVEDYMHTGDQMPLCPPDTMMKQAIMIMSSGRFGCVGITDETGKLQGIVTDGDLRRHIDTPDLLGQNIMTIMTKNPKTLAARVLAKDALHIMTEYEITAFFIVDDQKRPLGIVHIHDFQRAFNPK